MQEIKLPDNVIKTGAGNYRELKRGPDAGKIEILSGTNKGKRGFFRRWVDENHNVLILVPDPLPEIKWVNANPGAARDEQGCWDSVDGRFEIRPNYRHTVNPDSYTLYDHGLPIVTKGQKFDTVTECKVEARRRLRNPES